MELASVTISIMSFAGKTEENNGTVDNFKYFETVCGLIRSGDGFYDCILL